MKIKEISVGGCLDFGKWKCNYVADLEPDDEVRDVEATLKAMVHEFLKSVNK